MYRRPDREQNILIFDQYMAHGIGVHFSWLFNTIHF